MPGQAVSSGCISLMRRSSHIPAEHKSLNLLKFNVRRCSAAGGVAVTLTGHPFDTLKVRLQSQSSSNPIYSASTSCIDTAPMCELSPDDLSNLSCNVLPDTCRWRC